ncbi:MAG TPA: type I methionyl aminopeptidase [Chloroflexia bacterium]|jgi:methionyl aminopeptidase|nr:type I methionyl aminopeptidase [Chloroflexia bacterium]
MAILLKSHKEIEIMRQAGRIVAQTLALLSENVKPGVTTAELDKMAYDFIKSQGAIPSFKGYHPFPDVQPFPGTICASVNEEIVHGIPGGRVLKEGDIIALDCGVIYRGWQGDSATTVGVGKISPQLVALLDTTKASLEAGIAQAKRGNYVGDISHAVEERIKQGGKYGIVREYGGHGLGRRLWEEPSVPNHGPAHQGPRLGVGMVIAIEPMVNIGGDTTETLDDGWTVVTHDRTPSAHFEHTVAITENGPDILTLP